MDKKAPFYPMDKVHMAMLANAWQQCLPYPETKEYFEEFGVELPEAVYTIGNQFIDIACACS
jgi:hypothetical protein